MPSPNPSMNYATRYASVVDERFRMGSLTQAIVNDNFDWVGVQTVAIFSRALAEIHDYNTTGSNRYGEPNELLNAKQEMQITQDKSLTYTIDRMSEQDTMGTMEAAATLAENIDQVIIPNLDMYRIAKICASAPTSGTYTGQSHIITKASASVSAYADFLGAQELLDNDKVPQGGRICVVTPGFLNALKKDQNFMRQADLSQRMTLNGQVGEVDGVPIIKVPASYMPNGVQFFITNPIIAPSPIKLQEFRIHNDAPGISGALVEARWRYDLFVLNKKADAIVVFRTNSVQLSDNEATIAVAGTKTLTANVVPTGSSVTWASSNTAVATVSTAGVVTGVAAGTANITATITVSDVSYKDTCAVTVKA